MKRIKKSILFIVSIVIILTLFGCGVNRSFPKLKAANTFVTEEAVADYGARNYAPVPKMMMSNDGMEMETAASGDVPQAEKKIIKTIDLVSETKEFDTAINFVKQKVLSNNGIIDNSYVDSGNMTSGEEYRKSANFSIRIPTDKTISFLTDTKSKLNITFEQESIRDVTDTYDDTESRKNTLNIEEEKLNELLKKAKNVDEIIKIEEKLSDVRREIQNIEIRLKRLDKQIDYTTINLTINEVKDLTEYISKEDYSKENLIKQLNKNFEATKRFIINAGMYLFVHIPSICLILIVILVILLIIFAIRTAVSGTKKQKKSISANNNKKTARKKVVRGKKAKNEKVVEENTENIDNQ